MPPGFEPVARSQRVSSRRLREATGWAPRVRGGTDGWRLITASGSGGMTVAQRFARARPRLLRLAYSQLGDLGEAEDVVQEAWLRLERTGADSIDDLDAWLTTVVGRLALDALRSARSRREAVRRPLAARAGGVLRPEDPADRVTLDESVSYALLALLEQLSPAERTAFVLHDVFDMPFGEVAEVVGRTPEAVRQLASRARRHVAEQRPRFEASPDEHERAVRAFARRRQRGRPRRPHRRARPRRRVDLRRRRRVRSPRASRCTAPRASRGLGRHAPQRGDRTGAGRRSSSTAGSGC